MNVVKRRRPEDALLTVVLVGRASGAGVWSADGAPLVPAGADRVAVLSTAADALGGGDDAAALAARVGRLLCREACWTLGVRPCGWYACALNECAFRAPALDALFFELCPIDLRKLQLVLQFDCVARYARVAASAAALGLAAEAEWARERGQLLAAQ